MNYWLVCTTPENFEIDRKMNFRINGFKKSIENLVSQVQSVDRCVFYVAGYKKFGAIASITRGYYFDDKTKIWSEEDEIWPCRFEQRPDIVLDDEIMVDARKLVPSLTFITEKQRAENWGLAFHQSLRKIPAEDFGLIESEMKKALRATPPISEKLSEEEAKKAIDQLSLESKSLHDRLGEMLQTVGSWMGYNSFTRHRITTEHSRELDVAWLRGKNPEVAIEVQIGGNMVDAKDKLAEAKRFNFRKLIMVIEEEQLKRLNDILKFDDTLRPWLDCWSISSVYMLYNSGAEFFNLYSKLEESRYKERKELELI
ncbi:MAG: EVE domain-containing protein [Candidatus Hodarchaeota archaeon]